MTIKDFARLCDCHPQTLRYYDRENLLRPRSVDPWTGYRHYSEEQALRFVRIRNLQQAGFTIDEIRSLLDKSDAVISEAFVEKIRKMEETLARVHEIHASYLCEAAQMKRKIQEIRNLVAHSMQTFNAQQEFGIDDTLYQSIISNVTGYFDDMLAQENTDGFQWEEPDLPDASQRDQFLQQPDLTLVYEKHGWHYVKEFLNEFSDLKDGGEYTLVFALNAQKKQAAAFANTMLALLLHLNPGKKRTFQCQLTQSDDGKNHFWLLQKKTDS